MLERSVKNASISAGYFGMGLLLALRSCPCPCVPEGMCLHATAACRVFLHFAAANSSFIFACQFSGSMSGCWKTWTVFQAFPFHCRGIGRAEEKYVSVQWKESWRRCALYLVISAFKMCWCKLFSYYPSIFQVTWRLLEKTQRSGVIVNWYFLSLASLWERHFPSQSSFFFFFFYSYESDQTVSKKNAFISKMEPDLDSKIAAELNGLWIATVSLLLHILFWKIT